MIDFPPAKINLGLRVIRRRSDGYHDLLTVFYPIPLCDAIEIVIAQSLKLHTYGRAIPGQPGENLVVKAWQLLHQKKGIPPVAIHLLKNIPMGAGLGGGSSDGVFALRLLNQLFHLDLTYEHMHAMALQLGSDCPFFVNPRPCAASGRGEVLEPIHISLRGKFLLLVKPDVHINTREAYQNVIPALQTHPMEVLNRPSTFWKDELVNDFESWAVSAYPELGRLKESLYNTGAFYASMTGSGSAFYGLFEQKPDIPEVLKQYPHWLLQLTI